MVKNSKQLYICNNFEARNRNKNNKYKIPYGKPQCPTFKDDRCCGGCSLIRQCDNVVDCNCSGFVKSAMGGTDKDYYMKKSSKYSELGRIIGGKFDWDYFRLNTFKQDIKTKKFFVLEINNVNYIAESKSGVNNKGFFKCFIKDLNCYKKISYKDLPMHFHFIKRTK
nr:hypothetical protein [Clostridium acetobutylicum]